MLLSRSTLDGLFSEFYWFFQWGLLCLKYKNLYFTNSQFKTILFVDKTGNLWRSTEFQPILYWFPVKRRLECSEPITESSITFSTDKLECHSCNINYLSLISTECSLIEIWKEISHSLWYYIDLNLQRQYIIHISIITFMIFHNVELVLVTSSRISNIVNHKISSKC